MNFYKIFVIWYAFTALTFLITAISYLHKLPLFDISAILQGISIAVLVIALGWFKIHGIHIVKTFDYIMHFLCFGFILSTISFQFKIFKFLEQSNLIALPLINLLVPITASVLTIFLAKKFSLFEI